MMVSALACPLFPRLSNPTKGTSKSRVHQEKEPGSNYCFLWCHRRKRMPANILLVEDEKRMRQVIVMQLSDLDLHIHEAVDGQQAIDIFENETIHLVITDLKLPKINGMDVLNFIKETMFTGNAFIVI